VVAEAAELIKQMAGRFPHELIVATVNGWVTEN
jgi:hypothetical protein